MPGSVASKARPEEGDDVSFSWRYETRDGAQVAATDVPDERFPTQSDAESWIGEAWRDLLEKGVDQVSLLEGDRQVYGPMSLHPAE
jgi:hypothetical protein